MSPLLSRLSSGRIALVRQHSQQVYRTAQQKWQLGGIPKPKPILDDDDAPVDLSEDIDAVNGVQPNSTPLHLRSPSCKPTPVEIKAHRKAMKKAFPEGWSPPRKLSREAMDILRQLHRGDPDTFSTPVLADRFRISPEAVRRILKSKWEPPAEKRTAMVVKERKWQEEMRRKVKAERQSKRKLQSMNVDELRRLLKNDHFWREKDGRLDEDVQALGVGGKDRFTLR